MIGLSRIKSPITIGRTTLNKRLTDAELIRCRISPETLLPSDAPPERAGSASDARLDEFTDLADQPVMVFVCLSGGGARAARMSAYTMAFLETLYRERVGEQAVQHPFIDQIDGWSAVSGGSIYASYVANHLVTGGEREKAFDHLANSPKLRWATQRLGALASIFYFWPGNLGYAAVMQILTEWDLRNLFARTQAMFQEGRLPILPVSSLRKLGDLPPHPRFFFNATCLETGRPLIFSQSLLHRELYGDPLARLAPDPLEYWARGQMDYGPAAQPLAFASTLEDLGASPTRFPMAHAVFASSAFPGVFQPLILDKYRQDTNSPPGRGKSIVQWKRDGLVTIVDGGIYDNTGITTALEVLGYINRHRQSGTPARRMILLSIDANNEPDGYERPSSVPISPLRLDLPIRGILPAVSIFAKLYSKQKSLVHAALLSRVNSLTEAGTLDFFEVKLMDATKNSAVVRRIPTDFVLSDFEDKALQQAVAEVLSQPRPERQGKSVSDAFVEAVQQITLGAH